MRILLAGEGAIAHRHAEAMARIEDIEIALVVGKHPGRTASFAASHGVSEWATDLSDSIARPDIDAVVLATPTPLHASQAIDALQANKHVLVEIPMADSLADARRLVDVADRTARIAMVCHTRRFNPGHRWIRAKIASGDFTLQHLIATTTFMRRVDRNALGVERDWTDQLLWHHACHTVDIFAHQTAERVSQHWAMQGPPHPVRGVAMDMGIGLLTPSGALCTLSLSFNNDGPAGTEYRYIGDSGTYVVRDDGITDGHGDPVDLGGVTPVPGIEAQDREFFEAIAGSREPVSSLSSCLAVMETLGEIQRTLDN